MIILKSTAKGSIAAPPSKSMAHRLLIAGAFSERSVIKGVQFSKDIEATLSCLEKLGASVKLDGDTVEIGGLDPWAPQGAEIFCNESGSTLRFLLPICLLRDEKCVLGGAGRLMQRPLDEYKKICDKQGLYFKQTDTDVTVCGKITAGDYTVRGDISSQYITGLLYTLVHLPESSTLTLTGKVESASYIGLTIKALRDFGVNIEVSDDYSFYKIPGGQKFSSREMYVEGDYSNAAFLDALGLIGGEVSVTGLDKESGQGDRVYKEYFKALENGTPMLDITDCPDLGPILFALAAAKNGAAFTGTKRLRIKESDRVESMRAELTKFGITVTSDENTAVVSGTLCTPAETLCAHNDHRIVMSLAVLCTLTGGEIEGTDAVSKSYPEFFTDIKKLGIEIKED